MVDLKSVVIASLQSLDDQANDRLAKQAYASYDSELGRNLGKSSALAWSVCGFKLDFSHQVHDDCAIDR